VAGPRRPRLERTATVLSLVLLSLASCARAVREERREQIADTQVPVRFAAEAPRSWDFGDGTPRAFGRQVLHAFLKPGRYTVKGYDGEALADAVELAVAPRGVFRAVPADAQAVLIVRSLDELGPTVDFAERFAGAAWAQRALDGLPALAFALEQGSGAGTVVEGGRGVGAFIWRDSDSAVSFVSVFEPAAATAAFEHWLEAHAWERTAELAWRSAALERELRVVVDRGVLYAVVSDPGASPPDAAARIARGDALGLESSRATAASLDDLPSGGVVLLARPPGEGPAADLLVAALKVGPGEAELSGRLAAASPLWPMPGPARAKLLASAPEGPVAVLSLSVPAERVLSLLVGPKKSRARDRLALQVEQLGGELEAGAAALDGTIEALAYFDAEGFLRTATERGGHPEPRGTVLAEGGVTDAPAAATLAGAVMQRWFSPVAASADAGAWRWVASWDEQPVELSVTAGLFSFKAGPALEDRKPENLRASLAKRFGGAFGPGHVSFFGDVGQLRRELLVPRMLKGLDPRRVLTTQALSLTFLDRLTEIDAVLVDLAPDAQGAKLQAWVKLKPRDK